MGPGLVWRGDCSRCHCCCTGLTDAPRRGGLCPRCARRDANERERLAFLAEDAAGAGEPQPEALWAGLCLLGLAAVVVGAFLVGLLAGGFPR